MTVTILLDSGEIISVPIRFLVKMSDIDAGVYKEIELGNGEIGLLRVTDQVEKEWHRHCDSLRNGETNGVVRWLTADIALPPR